MPRTRSPDCASRLARHRISRRRFPRSRAGSTRSRCRSEPERGRCRGRFLSFPHESSRPWSGPRLSPNDRDETLGPNKPFRDLAWGLADRGIAVLRYDKRTEVHGGKMGGNKNLTVRGETIDDALLAVKLLRSRSDIDPKRIFILGHSLGGMLSPRIGAEDQSLAGLIILAGSTRPLPEVAREQLEYIASVLPNSGIKPEEGLKMLMQAAPESYWKDLELYKPAQVAAKLKMPMLILQGERDYQVTKADLQGWRDALSARKDVTIKSYPALNHLFIAGEGKSTPSEYERPGHVADYVVEDIAGWIGKVGAVAK